MSERLMKSLKYPLLFALLAGILIANSIELAEARVLKKIAFVRDGDVWLMNTAGNGQKKVVDYGDPANNAWSITKAWSPSSNKLAIANSKAKNSLSVYNMSTGKLRKSLVGQGIAGITDVDWLSDYQLVFVGQKAPASDKFWNSNIYRLNLKTRALTKLVAGGFDLVVSPGRRRLAYVKIIKTSDDLENPGVFYGREILKVKNLETGKTRNIVQSDSFYSDWMDARSFRQPRFAPDGKKIMVHKTGNDISSSIYVLNMNGLELARHTVKSGYNGYGGESYGYAEFVDDQRIAYLAYSHDDANKQWLRIARYADAGNVTVELPGKAFSFSSNKGSVAYVDSLAAPNGKIYKYNLTTKVTTLIAGNGASPTWQP